MPNHEKISLLTDALKNEPDMRRKELAEVWADLVKAAETDPKAREFVDRFGADGDLLFGTNPGLSQK